MTNLYLVDNQENLCYNILVNKSKNKNEMSKNICTIIGIIILTICIVIDIVAISEIHYNAKDDIVNINNYNMFNSNSAEDTETEEKAIKVSVKIADNMYNIFADNSWENKS